MEVEALVDSRHKHLLEPIRDLATNWNIDLASELEDYLHELESVTISFDDGESINFVEAALLIQGSACVYSKKVEYLYNLLYKCLEIVAEKKKTKEKNSVAVEGIDTDALFNDLSYLVPLDNYLVDGKTIDLDDSREFNYDKLRAQTMISRPPMGALDRADDGKQQFRVSDCVIHMSGALLFREKDGVLLDGSLQRIKSLNPAAALPFGSPQALEIPQDTRPPITPMEVVLEGVGEPAEQPEFGPIENGDGGGEDDDTMDRKHVDPEELKEIKDSDFDPLGTQIAEEVDEDALPDPWLMVDPHEVPRAKPKPFRKVVPKAPRNSAASVDSSGSFLHGLYANPAEETVRVASLKNAIKAPYWSQFAALYVARLQKLHQTKQEQLTKEKAQQQHKLVQLPLPVQAQEAESSDEDLDIAPVFDLEEKGIVNEWEELEEQITVPEVLPTIDELATLGQSYEDVCREHVDASMNKATKFLNETQISKRVAEWQAKLDPTLAAEEQRPPFDIHQYGRTLMEIMMTQSGGPPPKDLSTIRVDFHSAVTGKPRYDVCRYFLAALQLANNTNVVIAPSEVKQEDEKVAIMSMKLQLLSLDTAEVNIEGGASNGSTKRPRAKKKGAKQPEAKSDGDESEDRLEFDLEESKTSSKKSSILTKKSSNDVVHNEEAKHANLESPISKPKKRGR